MSGPISLQTFKQQIAGVGDDTKLRLKQDDSLSTSTRSLGGRFVRFFKPELDRADNRHIGGELLKGLQDKHGDKVGLAAMRMAGIDIKRGSDGEVYIATSKPLTARQVRDAMDFGRAMSNQQRLGTVAALSAQFAPENAHAFAKVGRDRNIDTTTLSPRQKEFYSDRLREQVLNRTHQQDGLPPKPAEIREIVGKVLKYTAGLSDKEIRAHTQTNREARDAGVKLAVALAGLPSGGSLSGALVDFVNKSEKLVEDTNLGAVTMGVGGQDIAKARAVALDAAISSLSPAQAKHLYQKAMAPDGAARTLNFALVAMTGDKTVQADSPRLAAVNEMLAQTGQVMGALAERAGIKGSAAEFNKVFDGGADVTQKELTQGKFSAANLATAGISSDSAARKGLAVANSAVDQRKPVIAENMRLDDEAIERAKELDAQDMRGSRSGSVSDSDQIVIQ